MIEGPIIFFGDKMGVEGNDRPLADAIKDYSIAAKITVVISNSCCAGITLAQDRGLPTAGHSPFQ